MKTGRVLQEADPFVPASLPDRPDAHHIHKRLSKLPQLKQILFLWFPLFIQLLFGDVLTKCFLRAKIIWGVLAPS
jgi:hypothetical protein